MSTQINREMSTNESPTQTLDPKPLRHTNGYHLQANGEAIKTVLAHTEEQELTLFG
jgi:hypothetical protein